MIADAISTLKERNGSSQQAIAKFIEEKHDKVLPPNFRKLLSLQLKNLVNSQRLCKVKNSYKISSGEIGEKKKEKKEKVKMLCQIKTPEALKIKNKAATKEKVKLLSEVKTPEAMKKKKPIDSTKPKPKPINSSRPTRKARK